jgi:hypothetical protein
VLLPIVMFCTAFLLQPACLLYTRAVMQGAAAETARAAATPSSEAKESWYEAYALRRLAAVPDVSVFHAGGHDDWEVEVDGMGQDEVSVTVRGRVRPLPLLGVLASAFGKQDGRDVVLEAKVSERMRPAWLAGSYGSWKGVWDA